MSKNTSPSGLLSRMAKFVKNSATGWSDLDQLDSRQDASDTRQALKDMIERKRRNDVTSSKRCAKSAVAKWPKTRAPVQTQAHPAT